MKSIVKYLVAVLFVLGVSSFWANSQDVVINADEDGGQLAIVIQPVPSFKFLTSKSALRAYAIEMARNATVEMESKGFIGYENSGMGTGWEGPGNLEVIHRALQLWDFSVPMSNPTEPVKFTGFLTSIDGDSLFVSYPSVTQAKPQKGGGYSFDQPYLYFRIAPEIPIRIDPSITYAEVTYMDEYGTTLVKESLKIANGKLYFKSDFAGKGILNLMSKKGEIFAYDLRNGGGSILVEKVAFDGINNSIEGVYSYKNPDYINSTIWSRNGRGENVTFEVSMTQAKWVNVSVRTVEQATAIGFYVRRQGDPVMQWQYYELVPPAQYLPINFHQGTYYVVPVWNPEEFKEYESIPEPSTPQPIGKG